MEMRERRRRRVMREEWEREKKIAKQVRGVAEIQAYG